MVSWVIPDWRFANRHINRDISLLSSPLQDEKPSLPAWWSHRPLCAWLVGHIPRSDFSVLSHASSPCQSIPATTTQTLGSDGKTREIVSHSLNNTSPFLQSQFPVKHFRPSLYFCLKPTVTSAIQFFWLGSVCVCVVLLKTSEPAGQKY